MYVYLAWLKDPEHRICKPFKELRNRFSAWQADMTTLFDIMACQDSLAGGIGFSESIPGLLNVYKFGLCFKVI
jgi:hypothetical protein